MSSSASSEAWSDEEQDDKKEAIQEKAKQSKTLIRPKHGEKLSFQAPPGYLPSFHSQELLTEFGKDSLKSNNKKQLWIIKIPEESKVSPSTLDGLVIKVPSSSSSTLAQVKIQTPVKGSASRTQIKSYSLRNQSSTLRPKESDGTSTQLIAMAGGHKAVTSSEADQKMAEGESLQVMLPQSHSQQGRYMFAPAPPKHHLRLVLDDQSQYDKCSNSTARQVTSTNSSGKRKREQPIGKLKGTFLPAGARSEEDKAEVIAGASPIKEKKIKEDKHVIKEAKEAKKVEKEVKKEKDKKKEKSK